MLERRRSFLNKRTRRATMGQADTTKKFFFMMASMQVHNYV